MTLTIAWWWFPIASVLAGIAGAIYFTAKPKGDFDMVSPMIGAGCFVLGCCLAAALVAGKYLL